MFPSVPSGAGCRHSSSTTAVIVKRLANIGTKEGPALLTLLVGVFCHVMVM